MEILLGFLASALGAAVAGFLAVRFGFQQLRRERAFDRRLAWYEDAVAKTQELRAASGALADRLENPRGEARELLRLTPFSDAFPAWVSSAGKAPIYASQAVATEVEAAVDRVGRLLESPEGESSISFTAAQLRLVGGVLTALLERLNAEARRHLSSD